MTVDQDNIFFKRLLDLVPPQVYFNEDEKIQIRNKGVLNKSLYESSLNEVLSKTLIALFVLMIPEYLCSKFFILNTLFSSKIKYRQLQ